MLEKIDHIVLLLDFYGPLLTEKQQRVMSLYYENDLSLTEIAEQLDITRQAIYDILKRSVSQLEDYEKRLNLVDKFTRTQQELKAVYNLLNRAEEPDSKELAEAVKTIRQVLDLV
jgi:predicted DNA-binding protein YlxM (UPF0122 family)